MIKCHSALRLLWQSLSLLTTYRSILLLGIKTMGVFSNSLKLQYTKEMLPSRGLVCRPPTPLPNTHPPINPLGASNINCSWSLLLFYRLPTWLMNPQVRSKVQCQDLLSEPFWVFTQPMPHNVTTVTHISINASKSSWHNSRRSRNSSNNNKNATLITWRSVPTSGEHL